MTPLDIIGLLREKGLSTKEIKNKLEHAKNISSHLFFVEAYEEFKSTLSEKLFKNYKDFALRNATPDHLLSFGVWEAKKQWEVLSSELSKIRDEQNSRSIQSSLSEFGLDYSEFQNRTMPEAVKVFTDAVDDLTFITGFNLGMNGSSYFITDEMDEWKFFFRGNQLLAYKSEWDWIYYGSKEMAICQHGLVYVLGEHEYTTGSNLDDIKCTEEEKQQLIELTPCFYNNFVLTEKDTVILANEAGQITNIGDDFYSIKPTRNQYKGFALSTSSRNYSRLIEPMPLSEKSDAYIESEGYINGKLAYFTLNSISEARGNTSLENPLSDYIKYTKQNKLWTSGDINPSDKVITTFEDVKPKFGTYPNQLIPAARHIGLCREDDEHINAELKKHYDIDVLEEKDVHDERISYSRSVTYVTTEDFEILKKIKHY